VTNILIDLVIFYPYTYMNKTKKRGKRKSNKNKNKSRKHTGPVKGGRVMGAKMHILPRFVPNPENKNNEMKAIVIPIYDNNPIMSGIKDTNDWIAYAFNQYPVIPAGVKVQTQTLKARYKKKDEGENEVKKGGGE
jgi:hypothetical protein